MVRGMSKLPDISWERGRHDGYTVVRLFLDMLRMDDGRVFSAGVHLEDPKDLHLMSSWPDGGLSESVHVLLLEALRQEALLGFLLRQTKDPGYLDDLRRMSQGDQEKALRDMAKKIESQMSKTISGLVEDVVKDVFEHMR